MVSVNRLKILPLAPAVRLTPECEDLKQIATGRFREAGESTALHHTGGAHSEIKTSPANECGIFG